MRSLYNVTVTVLTRVVLCAAGLAALGASAEPAVKIQAGSSGESGTARRHPLVVLKQTRIDGKVFFLPEEGEGQAEPARQTPVEIRDRDGGKVLHNTSTASDGTFSLPNLDVGVYQIRIGGLTLELSVEAKKETGKKALPKTLLIFMPRQLES